MGACLEHVGAVPGRIGGCAIGSGPPFVAVKAPNCSSSSSINPLANPSANPLASPLASRLASPLASPASSPLASPLASMWLSVARWAALGALGCSLHLSEALVSLVERTCFRLNTGSAPLPPLRGARAQPQSKYSKSPELWMFAVL